MLRKHAEKRADVLTQIRHFFTQEGFLEVETPVRVHQPAMEAHIDAIPAGSGWLRTSPEFHMKRLLAQGWGNIFQLGPCFRDGEQGDLHEPEFTMLEWYRTHANYMDILEDTRHLFSALVGDGFEYQGAYISLNKWEVVTIKELFLKYTDWNPYEQFDADRFDIDWVEKIEPHLPKDRPVVVKNYPLECGAFALACQDYAERWELYLGGIELANAYSELWDFAEIERRIEAWANERARNKKPIYPPDNDFLKAMKSPLPPTGGIALGIDRLIMLLTDAESLDKVMPFRW